MALAKNSPLPPSLQALDGPSASDPVEQNHDILDQLGSNEYGQPPSGAFGDWDKYFALLSAKNAVLGTPRRSVPLASLSGLSNAALGDYVNGR